MAVDHNELEFRVRYEETDQMGVVHHSKYAVYFEMGRTELLRACGVSYGEMEQAGIFFVVVRLETRFLAPARYDDVLRLTTRTTRLTRARIEHEYHLHRAADHRRLAEGHSVIACVDRAGQVIAIPDAFMAQFKPEEAGTRDRSG